MILRVRQVELIAMTGIGPFRSKVAFEPGLNVLWAPNTSGKTTCIMSILYALAMEGMLGPSQHPPLSDAMQTSLMDEKEVEHKVVESFVRIEIENASSESITIKRSVSGTNMDRQLMQVVHGPAISEPSDSYEQSDYYVRTAGAATNESGFHYFLAGFLGFEQPLVGDRGNDGIPMYLECVFPYFFVDQITGWRDLKSRMPTYLGIPQMANRAAEFLMALDIFKRSLNKQRLLQQLDIIRERWSSLLAKINADLKRQGIIIQGVPTAPEAIWPPTPNPRLLVTDGENWAPISEQVAEYQNRLEVLVDEEIPKAEEVSTHVLSQLRSAEESLFNHYKRLEAVLNERRIEETQLQAIDTRMEALNEDLRKHNDTLKLVRRGSQIPLKIASGICPTCQQPIKDALLHPDHPSNPMSLEENIAFIKDQIQTFSDMRSDASEAIEARFEQEHAIRKNVIEQSSYIRTLKATLKSEGQTPSIAAIKERLVLEERIDELAQIERGFEEIIGRFVPLAADWARIQSELKSAVTDGVSQDDARKLDHLEASVREQLTQYGFSSFLVDRITISRENYRPSREGYEIGVTSVTSASDYIRILWAYLVGLLELARRQNTNHLNLLILDEPKQQSANRVSFDALIRRAAAAGRYGQQVIFATSEEHELLEPIIAEIDCNLIEFNEKMLRRSDT